VGQAPPSRQLLGKVTVTHGRAVPADSTSYLVTELVRAAEVNMPADVRARVVDDLRHGLKLSSFVPHVTVEDKEVTGTQTLEFTAGFQVDGKSFDPTRIDRTLKLHDVDEWTLSSATGSHPFHIHVNPFQVVKILDPSGKDVSAPDAVDDYGGVSPRVPGAEGSVEGYAVGEVRC
jgi:FtsP/CotA-like multicopper oxidase with cupredoxin domain